MQNIKSKSLTSVFFNVYKNIITVDCFHNFIFAFIYLLSKYSWLSQFQIN